MDNKDEKINKLESNVEESNFKRLHEYEPIDFLKALVDGYKDKE